MTRGMRLMIVFCVFVVVIVMMMDCAKKTMKKKKVEGEGESHGWLVPGPDHRDWSAAHPAAPGRG